VEMSSSQNDDEMFYSSDGSVLCSFDCISDYRVEDCSNDFLYGTSLDSLCQNYCGFYAYSSYTACYETTSGTTICRVNVPSPLTMTLASGQSFTLGSSIGSSLLIEYTQGASLSSENYDCYIGFGSPTSQLSEYSNYCTSCTIESITDEMIRFSFDCSNVMSGECAIVDSAGQCINSVPAPAPVPVGTDPTSDFAAPVPGSAPTSDENRRPTGTGTQSVVIVGKRGRTKVVKIRKSGSILNQQQSSCLWVMLSVLWSASLMFW
jgi:hypothetical protein